MAVRKKGFIMKKLLALALAASVLGTLIPASAQTPPGAAFPTRTVRLMVPAAAGSAPDFLARVLGQKLAETWGQPVIVDNVVGAGGNIAAERIAKSPADGHALLFNTIGPIAINVSLYDKLPFDPIKDFAPITLVAKVPNILCVNPNVPVKSVAELIAYAKQNPGKLRYGSPGSGTSNHLSAELLNTMAGIKLFHVPYKSSAQMTTDTIGGQVELIFHNAPVVLPHVKSGALRGLAITSATRNPFAPELPTMAEAGVPGFEVTAWFGVLAPAGTPAPVLAKLHTDFVRMISMPDVKERFLTQAAEPIGSTPEEFASFINAEIAKWSKVIKASGAKVE
jgi:tripartite-type tricarboxylate transporter receptor subunit TctC